MSATTLVAPRQEEAINEHKDAEHPFFRDGKGISQSTLPVPSESELKNLNEAELKAAITSAWKKLERIGKKEMGPLLYWLREKLRAQGSRNDLRDQDKGFGAWVQESLEISRRTIDRWADDYGLANGVIKRRTSRQPDQELFPNEDDGFQAAKRRNHGRLIQMNYWVPVGEYQRHKQAVEVLKKHFKTSSTQDAIVKGVQYAAQTLARGRGRANRSSIASISRPSRHKQKVTSAN